jgi:hypothetical protein
MLLVSSVPPKPLKVTAEQRPSIEWRRCSGLPGMGRPW